MPQTPAKAGGPTWGAWSSEKSSREEAQLWVLFSLPEFLDFLLFGKTILEATQSLELFRQSIQEVRVVLPFSGGQFSVVGGSCGEPIQIPTKGQKLPVQEY